MPENFDYNLGDLNEMVESDNSEYDLSVFNKIHKMSQEEFDRIRERIGQIEYEIEEEERNLGYAPDKEIRNECKKRINRLFDLKDELLCKIGRKDESTKTFRHEID